MVVSIVTVNKAGDTPLSLACANGHLNTVKYLVNEHHCDPRSKLSLYVRTCVSTVAYPARGSGCSSTPPISFTCNLLEAAWACTALHYEASWARASLDPRPIRLQLNARSPPRPGIDCIWACIWACAVVAVVAQVFTQKERIPEQGGANRNTNSVCKHTYSVKSP